MDEAQEAVNETLQADPRLVALLQVQALSEAVVEQFRSLIGPFQEQGQLLDPILADMVKPVVNHIQTIIQESASGRKVATTTSFPFQALPEDKKAQLHWACQVLYLICKVRGYKTVVKLLPHDVAEYEPVLSLLQSQDRDDHSTWEIRYILLLWLSILNLVPFDLKTIDSSINGHEPESDSIALVANVTSICKNYLQDSGATQEAAALCLARLLSRPDMEDKYLLHFLDYVKYEFDAFCSIKAMETSPALARIQQYKITGIMMCLSYICKFTPREKHIVLMGQYFSHVMNVIDSIRDQDAENVVSSTLHRKLSTKLLQRMGLLYLPPRVMNWRYSRGLRSLEVNLNVKNVVEATAVVDTNDDDIEVPEELEQVVDVLLSGLRDRDTVVRWSAAKGVGRITSRLPFEFADDIVQSVLELFSPSEGDAAWHGASLAIAELSRRCALLPERLPEAVRVIGTALMYDVRRGAHSIGSHVRDAACYACWSFARAYEPKLFLPYLKKTLAPIMLTVCAFDRELNCRRAAAAAFQESVGRQGVQNFPHGIDLLTKADYFTLASISHAFLDVSRHIAKYSEYRYALIDHLATCKIYHWDQSIRELAATALGQLAPLDSAYIMTNVYPALLTASISTTSEVTVRHGATLALTEITLHLASAPSFIEGEIMKRLKLIPLEMDKRRLYRGRGGEMIRAAVCQIIQAISSLGWPVAIAILKKYLVTLEECIKHPNDVVRNAAVNAYEAVAARYLVRLIGSNENRLYLEAIIPRFLTNIQEKGVLNPNVATRRGFVMALGVTPFDLIKPHLQNSIDLMVKTAVLSLHTVDEQDAESRVAAIKAMTEFSKRHRTSLQAEDLNRILASLLRCADEDYGMDERGDVGSWVRKEAMQGIRDILISYADPIEASPKKRRVFVEKFGHGTIVETKTLKQPIATVQFDKGTLGYFYFAPQGLGVFQGSRVLDINEASADTLPPLDQRNQAVFLQPSHALSVPSAFVSDFCRVLVKQLSEKLDNIRGVAGSILFELFQNNPSIEGIPDRPLLAKHLDSSVNWSMASSTFPIVTQLLDSPDYMEYVVSGLVISVGGLTESVVKASKSSLLAWIKDQLKLNNFKRASQFAYHCVALFEKHTKDDRVIIPLMKTISICLEARVLDFLHKDGSIFGNALYEAVRTEIGKTSDPNKISAGLSVLVGLLPSESSVEKRVLRGIMVCLGHRFPKIRKLTAEKLYTRLILQEELIEEDKYDTVIAILSETAWDGEMQQARVRRDELNNLLGFEKIEKGKKTSSEGKTTTKTNDEDHSYEALVKEMGY